MSIDVVVELEDEGWVSDGGDDAATGKGAGDGKGDAGMPFGLGKNSRCDGAWVQLGLFGLPMGGYWVMTGRLSEFPGTTVSGIAC